MQGCGGSNFFQVKITKMQKHPPGVEVEVLATELIGGLHGRVILILKKFGILISTWFQVVPFGV